MVTKIKDFLEECPWLVVVVLAILGFSLNFVSGLILTSIGIIIYSSLSSARKKKETEILRKSLVNQARTFMDEVNENKGLPIIESSLFVEKDEKAILEEETYLFETRAIRQTVGGGAGFRVAKGVYLGGYSGKSESHKEWRVIDGGILTLTNKRLIFSGKKESRTIPIGKILSTGSSIGELEILIDGKSKRIIFRLKNSCIWSLAISTIRSAKDPFRLDTKINAEIV